MHYIVASNIPNFLGILLDEENLESYNVSTTKLGRTRAMEKNKILEAARNNKAKGREYEQIESVRGSLLGSFAAIIVGLALFLIDYFVQGNVNISLIVVAMTAAWVQSLYDGIKSRKLHLIIVGGVEAIMAFAFLIVFITKVVL